MCFADAIEGKHWKEIDGKWLENIFQMIEIFFIENPWFKILAGVKEFRNENFLVWTFMLALEGFNLTLSLNSWSSPFILKTTFTKHDFNNFYSALTNKIVGYTFSFHLIFM